MATATPTAPAGTRERAIRAGIALLGVMSLVTGIWMALSPASFFDALGPFGEQNSHYLRDMATWQIAFGAALLVAVGRPPWNADIGARIADVAVHFVEIVSRVAVGARAFRPGIENDGS